MYQEDVDPLTSGLIGPLTAPVLDVGCGDGRVLRTLAHLDAIGCDISTALLGRAVTHAPVVCSRLPGLGWLRDRTLGGIVVVLVLEHISDLGRFMAEAARVTRPGGHLVAILNHPAFTAPGAGPITDPVDSEVTWRWGSYFDDGSTLEPAGANLVRFHHRSLSTLLTTAAIAGWSLDRLIERPIGSRAAQRDPILARQRNIPRLLGVRWRLSDRRG